MKRKTVRIIIILGAVCALLSMTGILFASNQAKQSDTAVTPERILAQIDGVEEQIDLPPITKEPPRYPNLDSNLSRLVVADTETAADAGRTRSNDGGSSEPAEPALVTFYIEPEQVDAVREYLEDNGVFVRNVGEDYIEAHVPPPLLGAASEQPGVLRVDTVIPPRANQSQTKAISQGVGLHGADAWHNAGYRGQTVKVGVIDSGFEGFSRLQESELPGNVTARCYFDGPRQPTSRLADCEVDGDHGTAVAETLVDVAPDVELYIANPYSRGDLRNAVDWMAEEGVKVINVSLGYPYDGPGDGTSRFSNSPLKIIDVAVAHDIAWINGAGNGAQTTWYGTFRDPSNTGVHHWAGQDIGNDFVLEEGEFLRVFMRWDDDWGQADCDLDLEMYDSRPGPDGKYPLVGWDDSLQYGSPGSDPLAGLVGTSEISASEAGVYFLVISKWVCTDDPAWIQLTTWIDNDLQYSSSGHHMGNPEESRNPGMMAVGATHYWDTNAIAAYSSRGPTLDGRTKPDITGVACGQATTTSPVTVGVHQCWFSGTSQAAPHVAGLAALVRQHFPDYTPAQTVRYLQENASERGPSGSDNTWGYGLAALPDPSTEPTPGSGEVAPTGNIDVRPGQNPGEFVVTWDAVPGATHYRIGYVNMEVDYHFAKGSCTEEWIEAFIYVDVNARNIPVSNGRAEYTVRRLSEGARHAFTVLTSNDFIDTGSDGSVSSEFFWPPSGSRWKFVDGRRDLPPGVVIPQVDCGP